MSFKNIYFPLEIGINSTGGPEFLTLVSTTQSGKEFRSSQLQYPRIRYNVSTGLQSTEDIKQLMSFFRIVCGRMHSFRFKDFLDFQAENQPIQIIDANTRKYQLIKQYIVGENAVYRKITKPIPESVTLYHNNIQQPKESYFVDSVSGEITISGMNIIDPSLLKVSFEFDIEARFDVDRLDIGIKNNYTRDIKDVNVIEVI